MADHALSAPSRATAVGALTLALAAAGWALAVPRMTGMDMGVATELGSFGSFLGLWVAMMAAMMLPGAVPAVQRSGRIWASLTFVLTYLAVWTAVGVAVYVAYRPHGPSVAAAVVIAAGLYELTPWKRHFRNRCRKGTQTGARYGLCCVGSTLGLMLLLVVLGVMSLAWMAVITAVALAQKLLPPKAVRDVPLALVLVAVGIWIAVAPGSVPGLLPAM